MNQYDADLLVESSDKQLCAVDCPYEALHIFAEKCNQTQSPNDAIYFR